MRLQLEPFAILIAIFALLAPIQLRGENWIMVEATVFPKGCKSLTECISMQTDHRRNLMALDQTTTGVFLETLDTLADVSDGPSIENGPLPDDFKLVDVVPLLTGLSIATKPEVLRGIPGIYFDASRVSGDDASDHFIADFSAQLTAAGVPVLSEEEARALPGAARMSVSLSQSRENAGCIFPFRASLTLKEEVVLVRDPTMKFETTSWSYSVGQDFTAVNYLGVDALSDAAQRFIDDYMTANAG